MASNDCIYVGDQVRVEFLGRMKNDLLGRVLYIPASSGDCWIIRSVDRLFYVQQFAAISKIVDEVKADGN